MLEGYLAIMEMRFPSRLRVQIQIPRELHSTPVPSLLLQPLVENVLQHALDEYEGTTDVLVSATLKARSLVLAVADNGRGLPADEEPRFGIGLENTRTRLETLYGAKSSLDISDAAPSGTRVELVIPIGGPS
jgi:LytS/YehU family sensor histidine kinase